MILQQIESELRSFAFLSDRHVLLAMDPTNDAINQYTLVVADFHANHTPGSYTVVREFLLPPLAPWCSIGDMLIRSDPAPSYHGASTVAADSQVPFLTAPDNRLFVITCQLGLDAIILFVPLSTFTSFLDKPTEVVSTLTGLPRSSVLWDHWGPHGSRMMEISAMEDVWVCYVYGSRCIRPRKPKHQGGRRRPRYIDVLDFNPLVVRRLTQKEEETCLRGQVVRQATTILAGEKSIFQEDVTTHLPYFITRTDEKVRFDAVMLTEENLVTVKVSKSH